MTKLIGIVLLSVMLAAPDLAFADDVARSSTLRLQQFIDDPSLMAQRGQTVILDGLATDADGVAIGYELQAGNHEFCLSGNQPYFSGIVLENIFGQEVFRSENGPNCSRVDLPAGAYSVRILHHKSAAPTTNRVALLTVDPLNPPLVDSTGDAIGGYWAVQPDPSNDSSHRDGRFTTNPSFAPFGSYSPFNNFTFGGKYATYGNFIQAEFGVTQMDQYSLFSFQYGNSSNLAAYYPPNSYLNRLVNSAIGVNLGVSTCTCDNNACPIDPATTAYDAQPFCLPFVNRTSARLSVVDLGHYEFSLWNYDYYTDQYNNYLLSGPTGCLVKDGSSCKAEFQAVPIVRDNCGPPGCGQPTAPFHVVFRFFPNGRLLPNGSPAPLQEGEVALYESCNYQGKAVVLGTSLANFLEWNSDVVDLDKLGASVQVGNNTAATFYSDLNFTGSSQTRIQTACIANPPKAASVLLQTAASVLIATRKCPNCFLQGVDFSGVNLASTDLNHANLSGAKFYGATLNNANLDGANLSGAFLTKAPAGGVAASLEGAFLRNVNLSQAQLSGADFTNASFYSTIAVETGICVPNTQTGFTSNCASAAGAVLNNTQFGGAYLFGVDFSNSSIQGVQFANTFLTGANFNGATISVDASIGTNSGFSAAFLQGTNLATTKSLLSVSLQDAFVDFSSAGNTMYLSLNGYHTNFPGYWNTPGQPVCAEMYYGGASGMPVDNSTITCPNGQSGPCGKALNTDGTGNPAWESPVDISQFASYQFDATFTKAPTSPTQQKCAYDPRWLTSGLGASQPPKVPHHKPHDDDTKSGNTHSEHQDVHVDRF